MKKKIISVLLATAMVASLVVGCGNSSESAKTDDTVKTEEKTENAADDTVEKDDAAKDTAEVSSDGDTYKIAWVDGNLANESNSVCTAAAKAYAESITDSKIEFTLLDGEGSGEKQVDQTETLIAQGVDCIMMQPYDAAACQVGVQACIDAGVKVLVVKAPIEDQSICPFIGQDDIVAGQMEMDWVADQLGEKGNIVILEGPTGNSAALNRNDGITKALESYADINVLYTQTGNWNRDEGMSLMENWLQTGEQIDAVVAHNDEMALGAYDAIADAGKVGEIKVIGIDAIDAAKESVSAGEMDATILQDVEGIAKKAVDVAVMLCKGEEVEDTYYIDPVLLTKDNIADYM
ncbi:MAG: substrate-binding domain-containing protein [Lachnospiraceae bacterium]|nr:substrate-binding domain-containing protein [Lachnospiraceae bacterium]